MSLHLLPYRVFLLSFFSLIGSYSCQETQESPKLAAVEAKDSTLSWIDKGKEKSIDKMVRKTYLDKAYSRTLVNKQDTTYIRNLGRLSLAYLQLPDNSKFQEVNDLLISIAESSKDSSALANAFWDRGSFYKQNSVMDSSFLYYDQAHKIFLALDEKSDAAKLLRNMAVIQNNVRDYVQGESNLVKAIELFKELDDYEKLYKSYNSLGITQSNLQNYEKALEYYEEALKYLNASNPGDHFRLKIINNMGMAHLDNGKFVKASEYFSQVINLPQAETIDPATFGRALTNLGITKVKRSASPERPEEYDKALFVLDALEDYAGLSKTLFALAEFYSITGDNSKSIERAQRALKFARMTNNNERELASLKLLASVDTDNASKHSAAYFALQDSLLTTERQLQNKFARIQFETDEALAENELLARQRVLWLGLAIGFLLLALSVYIIAAQRARNQKLRFLQEQQETNQEIFNLMMKQNQRLEEGKQLEQQRISEELHDGILGQMNGIRMVLLGLNAKSDLNAVDMRSDAIDKLQEVQEEIRNISHALNDASIQKVNNFLTSVTELLESTGESAGLKYTLDYDKDFDWDNLSGEIKINLYRILQESIQNCVKHANATEINIEFTVTDGEIQATIRDNGNGFKRDKQKSGIGHKNIESRIQKLGGSWHIESTRGRGTLVIAFIPLDGMRSPYEIKETKPVKTKHKQKIAG
ncbi:MAG: tetratricopeptide repeat protein [Flavobacteriaceae bacterium]|nr:tetratricopeptide repeat protein [Flavobacteriaceae bacterium]